MCRASRLRQLKTEPRSLSTHLRNPGDPLSTQQELEQGEEFGPEALGEVVSLVPCLISILDARKTFAQALDLWFFDPSTLQASGQKRLGLGFRGRAASICLYLGPWSPYFGRPPALPTYWTWQVSAAFLAQFFLHFNIANFVEPVVFGTTEELPAPGGLGPTWPTESPVARALGFGFESLAP